MPSLNGVEYKHWSKVPKSVWPWTSFTPKDIASKGDGSIIVVPQALNKLQALFDFLKKPIIINDAYRDRVHNANVGGEPTSLHKEGQAFDLSTRNIDRTELYQAARQIGFTGCGLYRTFLHCDIGRARTWYGAGISIEEYKKFFGK